MSLFMGSWVIGIAELHSGNYVAWWAAFTFASAGFIPAMFLAFTRHYPNYIDRPSTGVLGAVFAVAGILGTLSFATDLIVHDVLVTPSGLSRKIGPLYYVFAAYFILVWGAALSSLVEKWRRARGLARVQLQYLGLALVTCGVGGIGANLLLPLITGRSTYSWIGPVFVVAFVGPVVHAIIRHRLMDLRLVIRRGLTIALAMVLSLSPIALLMALAWPRLSIHFDSNELVLMLLGTLTVTLLVPPTRDLARRLLDRYVYRTQADYQRTVREASQMLTRVLNLTILLPFVTRTVATSTGAAGVALYLRKEDGFRKTIGDKYNEVCQFEIPPVLPFIVIDALQRMKEPVVADEIAREPVAQSALALSRSLVSANWALVLPVLSEDTVIATIVLGPKLSGDPYYPQDLDLLMTLANQAGIAIKNAQLYDQVVLANEYIENIVATIESGVVAVNASGQVVMFNRAAEQLTGLSATSIKGRSLDALPMCLSEPLSTSIVDGRATVQPEIELPNGPATLPAICTTSPLRDPDGTVLGAVAVFSDLTPLKELEVERRRAERLAYFEVLASGLAHEIKNPLVAIKTFTQLLPRRRHDDRFIDEFGRIATREMERMERLLERLRTLSRPGERPRHPLDVRAAIQEALESVQPACDEKNITITAFLGPTPCFVRGDHGELGQLFLNLLMNAHEATPPGGALMVDLTRTGEHVAITVGDTGPGIPSDLLERVFDPFFTTKQRGSGLGLTICAGIAQTHDARLRAGNRAAGGASLSIEFSLVPVPAPVAR
jgi:PAS domain S-box-containing protein